MKKLLAALIVTAPIMASAGVVSGDNVSLVFSPSGGSYAANTVNGVDLNLSNFHFDFDAGANHDQFLFTSTPQGGFLGGSNSFTVGSLAFTGGETLVGFNLFSTSLNNLSFSTTANSVTFHYTDRDGYTDAGTVLYGQYVTQGPSTGVPEPTSLVLLGSSLFGIAALRRRRRA